MIVYRKCPLCDSSQLTGDAMDLHREGPHISRARCKSCGLVFANPMADQKDLEKYYNNYYEKEVYVNTDYKNLILSEIEAILKMDKGQIVKKAPYFSKFNQTGKFLDIGCGLGMGLAYAKRLGFELYATEYDQGAIDFVGENFPVKVSKGDVHDANFPDNYFDFIHISHVIEHVLDPEAYFREMYRILKPGGTLAVGTPDMSSLLYRGYKWASLLSLRVPQVIDGLEHTFIFPKKALANLAKKHGFTVTLHYSHGLGEKLGNLARYKMPLGKKMARLIQNFFKINQWMVCSK